MRKHQKEANMTKQTKTITEKVLPIKDTNVLHDVEDTLLNNFRYGRRNFTIFQVGKATLLRVSDVLNLKMEDVYNNNGSVKKSTRIRDIKTKKHHTIYLKPVSNDLAIYYQYRQKHNINSEWLFPSSNNYDKPITTKQFYKIMAKTGDLLGIDYLGTHSMRKTGAYRVYQQTGHDIALVMKLLNHSSAAMTLSYLGLEQESREHILDHVNFD